MVRSAPAPLPERGFLLGRLSNAGLTVPRAAPAGGRRPKPFTIAAVHHLDESRARRGLRPEHAKAARSTDADGDGRRFRRVQGGNDDWDECVALLRSRRQEIAAADLAGYLRLMAADEEGRGTATTISRNACSACSPAPAEHQARAALRNRPFERGLARLRGFVVGRAGFTYFLEIGR